MTELPLSTLEKILAAAKAEFLEKGYQSASLRNIVKSAGVTTGAFYGYYSSKEALFAALVDEPYRFVLRTYRAAVSQFEQLQPQTQVLWMGDAGKDCMQALGHPVPQIDRRLEHMLLTGMINTFFEIIIHDMPLADAQRYLEPLAAFYTAGWRKLMGQ